MKEVNILVVDDSGFERVVKTALAATPLYTGEVALTRNLHEGAQALWRLCWVGQDQLPQLAFFTTRFRSGSTGYRLLEFMRGHDRLRSIPVIMCSAESARAERYFARRRGAFYLNMTANSSEVARVLSWVLAQPPESAKQRR